MDIEAEQSIPSIGKSKPFDEASLTTKLILKTDCRTANRDKCRDYQFIGCIGIRRKDGRACPAPSGKLYPGSFKEQENLSIVVKGTAQVVIAEMQNLRGQITDTME